ncbi:hypothetical protein [uncultured Bradyrhizobium sp.]
MQASAINAALFSKQDGARFELVWNRPKAKASDESEPKAKKAKA